ncbi:GMC family oxidoreductase [Burkholderia ubonensis]|uniref:GMC family oxidoreductase n=1 Tax=Burkholderia ubonensis TaxID=101571 RepID=A0AB74D581_9BURK|nr:GMC family oxidoreductase [Burkholderia ubonensis]PAJ81600.1 hypothetical protein CJO71_06680 [Burkholderia ubonensis]PAJ88456.1 hypothetical protein CJO70_06490 [Burkholderia ubonensis]PAJ95006.1 hypothetical protein CJO69_08880 [Burkholderia ubonensis]PAJ99294.1 hypothetical protein CJO68_21945 [Burkholderia ubonensis]PAK08923.1 hypothetical protein CJO67_06240 [Burkholderia ubonensis]
MANNHEIERFEVVIVGSGVAGALAAYRLALAGAKVLILEAGGFAPEEEHRVALVRKYKESSTKSQSSPYRDVVAPQPNIDAPKGFGTDYYVQDPAGGAANLFMSFYERLVGGATWHWQGLNIRMLPNDFRLHSEYGVGFDWPIGYDDLEKWYCEAELETGVAGDHDALNGLHGAYRSKSFPMPAIVPSYLDRRFEDALRDESFDGVSLRVTTVPQARNSVEGFDGRPVCTGYGSCIPLCPIRAKYEAIFHVEKARDLGAQLREKAVVTELECDADGRISAVNYIRWDGSKASVSGKIVVIAANGIETPKILLSSVRQNPDGVANSSGAVGRYLMDHPIKMSYALAKDPVYPFRGPPSTSSIESLRDGTFRAQRGAFRTTIRNDGWAWPAGAPRGTDLTKPGTLLDFVGNKHLFGSSLKQALAEHAQHQIVVNSAVEMLPNWDNRIFPSKNPSEVDRLGIPRPELQFHIDDYTRRSFLAALRLHAQIFDRMQAKVFDLQGNQNPDAGSGHIMGTTIMGADAKTSVVDADCRSHDHPNLFILGSSVFPTGSTANPTLTVAALALRAADTINLQLRQIG